jgi:hypothetical protein
LSVYRYDVGSLGAVERLDNGFLRCPGQLTKVGVFPYLQPDGTVRRELRLPDEVFNTDSLATFEDAPLTNDHPPPGQRRLTAKTTRRFSVGHVRDVKREDAALVARIIVTDAQAIAAAESGKRQLSCGSRVSRTVRATMQYNETSEEITLRSSKKAGPGKPPRYASITTTRSKLTKTFDRANQNRR